MEEREGLRWVRKVWELLKHWDFIVNSVGGHWRVLSGAIMWSDLIFKVIILIVFGEIYQKKVSEGGILKVIAIIQGGIDGAQ